MNYIKERFFLPLLVLVIFVILVGSALYFHSKSNADVMLPNAYVGTQYNALLAASLDLTEDNLNTAVNTRTLPSGLSIQFVVPPCAPQASMCPAQPTLSGVPMRSGIYHFVLTTPSGTVGYELQIGSTQSPPNIPNNSANSPPVPLTKPNP